MTATPAPAVPKVDPVTFEVIRHRLWAINDEQALIAARTSGSPVVYEIYDFNAGILSAGGDGLFAGTYILQHATTLDFFVHRILAEWPREDIHEGDMFFTNDPWYGALHSSDGILVTPVFWEGEIVAWSGIAMHDDDVGSPVPGSFVVGARDRYGEAPLLPMVRMVEGFEIRPDMEATFLNNSRTPEHNALNMRARMASLTTTHRRIHELISEYGVETFLACQGEILDYVERIIRRRLTEIPDGTWFHHAYIDHNGNENELYRIPCRLTKHGERLRVDFTGAAAQAPGSINCARAALEGSVYALMLMYLCYDLPWSVGAVRRVLEIVSEPGTINNAVPPAATSMASIQGTLATQAAASNAFAKMLLASETLRSEAQAVWSAGPNCLVYAGIDDRRGEPFTMPDLNNCGGGAGARTFADGMDTGGIFHSMSSTITNIETVESRAPLLVVYRRQRPDSCGHGRFRGGVGLEAATIPHRSRGPVTHVVIAKSVSQPDGHGLAGGTPAAVNYNLVLRGSDIWAQLRSGRVPRDTDAIDGGELDILEAKQSTVVDGDAGDVFVQLNTGGGGYGDPLRRDPELVLTDVRRRLISAEVAEEVYGVCVEDGAVDGPATAARRDETRRRRLAEGRPVTERRAIQLAGPEPLHRVADTLEAVTADGRAFVRCTECGEVLGPYGQDTKDGMLVHEAPIEQLNRLNRLSPRDDIVARHFCCAGCGTALALDIQLRDEPLVGECAFGGAPGVS